MKILHIVEDFSLNSGGLRTVIKNLDFYLKSINNTSHILASKKENGDAIHLFKGRYKWLYSKGLCRAIDEIVKQNKIEIIHVHGVWLYPQYVGAKYAVKNGIPFVLTPHGMYQPWLWKKNTLSKRMYFHCISKKWYSQASVIQSITPDETKNLKKLFPKSEFVEIPNLINMVNFKNERSDKNKYILYLGRLNKTKGIDLLINAFYKLKDENVTLKIAGGDNSYKKELETLVSSLNLKNKVEFLGLVENKRNLISNAWVMISPSFSDVIGMVNLEAASFKTPVITTHQTGLRKEWNENGGNLIHPEVNEITNALEKALNWSMEERNSKGEQLYNFVMRNYSWKSRLQDWTNLYEKVLKK